MIDTVLRFSVRHKLAVLLATVCASIAGYMCFSSMRLDALPDLGDTQVIIHSSWDRSADLIESQVTYPIVSALLGTPHVKAVRGISDFGSSYVYVVFDDDTDLYWARTRTMEYLSGVRSRLPDGVKTDLGPDATSLGWAFQYVVTDTTGQHTLADLRSYQDWYLRYYLKAVPGVADVASIGGFTRQYQVNLDPRLLEQYDIPISLVAAAVRGGNEETSARVLEFGGTEYIVRGQGYATSLEDFANIVVATPAGRAPIRVGNLGEVVLRPDMRRGLADLDGNGDVVSGIVIVRSGENTLQVIDRVKAKLREIEPGLPNGVKVTPIYDRSALIEHTIGSVRWTMVQVALTVVLIIAIFLWHLPSAVVPILTMPAAVLIACIPLRAMGISLNVMSLAGLAIAFGELVDASIVIVEQTHKKLELWEKAGCPGSRRDVVLAAVQQVARPTFFALLVIAASLLPVLALGAQEGRMFKPLAYSKSAAMVAAAILVITLDPALRMLLSGSPHIYFRPAWLSRGFSRLVNSRILPEEKHPVSRLLIRAYEPVVAWALRHRWVVLGAATLLILATIPIAATLGSEYMPPMDEGSVLYMPTTMPGISVSEARQVLEGTDAVLKHFPEVDYVLGKAGRADTATDPAPLSMLETLIILKPRSEWPPLKTWYSRWAPPWMCGVLRHITDDRATTEDLIRRFDAALKVPGFTNAWTMPIRGRMDMLASGIRTPVGIKITGDNLATIEEIGQQLQVLLPTVPGTRGAFAERANLGHYIDVAWRREELARYGISVSQAQQTLNSAVGGDTVATVIEGRARYPVSVRYMRDFRDDIGGIGRILLTAGERKVPISDVASVKMTTGPAMIRDEDGLLTGYVYVDIAGRDAGSYVQEADRLLRRNIKLPPGFSLSWSGQYQAMQRVDSRLRIVIPFTLVAVIVLIYLSTRSLPKTMIVMLAVPFSAVGAVWLLYLLHYNMSVAVWVGLIGLLSVDAETGVFMLLYLDLAYDDARARRRMTSVEDLHEAIIEGAAKRLRPKFMTFATTCIGLLPVLWSLGAGSDVLKRVAAPMAGGIFTSFLLELLVYPVVYELWRRSCLPRMSLPGAEQRVPVLESLAFSTNRD